MSEINAPQEKFFDFSALSPLSPVSENDKSLDDSPNEEAPSSSIAAATGFFFDLTADEQEDLVKKGQDAAIEESAKRGDILAQKSAEKLEAKTEDSDEESEEDEPQSEYAKANTQL